MSITPKYPDGTYNSEFVGIYGTGNGIGVAGAPTSRRVYNQRQGDHWDGRAQRGDGTNSEASGYQGDGAGHGTNQFLGGGTGGGTGRIYKL